MELILAAIFAAVNNVLAKKKGHNGLLWGFISFIAYIFFTMIGSLVLVLAFFKGNILTLAQQPNYMQQLSDFFYGNVLNMVTVQAIGFGGFLLIYYIISRLKPAQNNGRNMPQ